ncbi:MAG: VOC family protein [Myxococcota bacterium]|nr:VOC family protein [Myxococcota bacterium]
MSHPRTQGVHHAGLTVPDLAASQAFFQQALGFEAVGEVPDYPAVFLSDGQVMITLWQAENGADATPFDRKRVIGLHHLALQVDAADLDALHGELQAREDVSVEFTPESLGGGATRHMMCTIPGGIRLELIGPAS